MMFQKLLKLLFPLLVCSSVAFTAPLPYSELNPSAPDPAKDPDIDMYIGNWRESMPRSIHGSLIVRDILTKCTDDPMKPSRKSAVLTEVNSVSYATLDANASTTPGKLSNEQEMYYIQSGKGILKYGKKTADLREGIGLVIDPGIEFSMQNTGDEPLTMYLVSQPIPQGYKLKTDIVINDEYTKPQSMNVHWSNIDRPVNGGGSVFGGMTAVKLDPMTIAQPHSHGAGTEEVWIALKGDIKLLFGKQLRQFTPGSAYRVPWDNVTAHANINFSDKQVKLIHMMIYKPGVEPSPYGQLDPNQFDPKVDADIDQFMGYWKDSMPRILFGALVVRDMLTKGGPDPLKPPRKSAALQFMNFVSYATLEEKSSTMPSKLDGEQHVYYINSGTGTIKTGGKTVELRKGIGILLPPGLEFTMTAGASEPLTMYIFSEPVPQGFKANTEIKVVDETQAGRSGPAHWSNWDSGLFGKADGLATFDGIGTTLISPMTIAQPHSHAPGWEEVWFGIEGDIRVFFGKQLRVLPVGAAYKIPADSKTPHANINISNKPMKLMVIIKTIPK